jgi:segregation and condensation protein B
MSPSPDPSFPSRQSGISLDELAAAFAQVMEAKPGRPGDSATPPATPQPDGSQPAAPLGPSAGTDVVGETNVPAEGPAPSDMAVEERVAAAADDDACPISPQSILEAMLFVGNRENRPLSPTQAAELMRGVRLDEVPALVDELNHGYAAGGCPYEIVGEGNGYRLVLRRAFHALRNRFFGRIRETRLSQPTIDVLALVAYQQPITAEQIGHLRDKPSSHILAHLVRRGLLRIERPDPKRRTAHYHTTDRFLRLFNLQSLDDLPRSEDAGPS